MSIIVLKQVTREYVNGDTVTKALGPVDITIKEGSFVVIVGKSGSGKSTLLNILCGLDTVTTGSVIVQGKELADMNRKELARYRGSIGIIFQFYNLLPNLNTLENILMGSWVGGSDHSVESAMKLLEKFQLNHRAKAKVTSLSGGEKQRASIARSLINKPEIIFCDEPTGALDSQNEEIVINYLKELHKEGKTLVMVTHNPDFMKLADHVIRLEDGTIVEEKHK